MGNQKKSKKKTSDKFKRGKGKKIKYPEERSEASTSEVRPEESTIQEPSNSSVNINTGPSTPPSTLQRVVEDDPDIFPEGTVCLLKKKEVPSPMYAKQGLRMSVDDPTIAHAIDPSRKAAKTKKKSPEKSSYFSPLLWRRSKAGESPHMAIKNNSLTDLPSPLQSPIELPNTPPTTPCSTSSPPSKPVTPGLLERLRSNMTVRRDSADNPATQESLAKLGSMVNTIKVTNRINKSRARRVGVIGRPGSLVLPDNQFISQLYEGLPPPLQRVVIPQPTVIDHVTESGHVTDNTGHVVSPGEESESGSEEEEELNYTTSSPYTDYTSPLSTSSYQVFCF